MTTRNHKSIEQCGGTYSFTASIMGWKHIFIKKKYLDCIIDSFRFHQEKKDVYTVGYCIMPSHLHWIIKLNDSYKDISMIVGAFKSFIAHEIIDGLKIEKNGVNRPLHPIFKFPQRQSLCGAGKNPNLAIESPSSLLGYFARLAHRDSDQDHRFWQRNSDIKLIETYSFLRQKLYYIHRNPVKDNWNIVKEPSKYPFSSSRYYEEGVDWHGLEIMNLF
jgi:putative transposase